MARLASHDSQDLSFTFLTSIELVQIRTALNYIIVTCSQVAVIYLQRPKGIH